ncbi:MAG: DNA topoisomerase I, partial [Muribaculaceae bacterium]|nr:DNA topoisomerase I [Muribaculaceae bacterium]
LIRQRTLASQMADADLEKTHVDISTPTIDEIFRAEGEVVKFEGFMKAYHNEDNSFDNTLLPPLKPGDELKVGEMTATERFSMPPARYTEATLVKKMEDLGIGRPSTYAPTISTIQHRDYIKRGDKEGEKRDFTVLTYTGGKITEMTKSETAGSDKGRLVPTDVGMIVNDFLTEYFPDILDYNFTARVEEKFDDIAEGKLGWKNEIKDFYGGFHPSIERINDMRMDHKVGERVLGNDPKSGKPVSVKIGRFGPVVQIGEASDDEKPLFASLAAGQSISTLTLEEALKLFDLPRRLGDFENGTVEVAAGRFGPYIRFAGGNVSLPKGMAPETITLEEAVELIEAKRAKDAASHLKDYPEIPGLTLIDGRYGPYLAYKPDEKKKAINYKIPKGKDPMTLTVEEIRELMAAQDAAPAPKRRKKS